MDAANPPPDRSRCPICWAPLASTRCATCGTDLSGPMGLDLWQIDSDLHRLSTARVDLVARLTARPPAPHAAGRRPPPQAWAATPAADGPAMPGTTPMPPLPPFLAPGNPVGARPGAGPQVSSLLLGLGVALLVVAAVIFAAVSWSGLGALGQGALLVGLTAIAGVATTVVARRGLRGTAEALGVLTVVMAPLVAQAVRLTLDLPTIEDRTWSTWASWTWWPAAIVVIGAAALAFGRAVRVRSPQVIGTVLVQAGLPIWVGLAPLHPAVIVAVLAGQALVVAAGPGFLQRDRPSGALWMAGATTIWTVAAMVATAQAFSATAGSVDHLGAVLGLGAVAASAGAVAWRWQRHAAWAGVATAGSALAAYGAIARGLTGSIDLQAVWPVMGGVAALGILAADRAGGRRGAVVRGVGWTVAWMAALPVLVAVGVAAEAMTSTDEAWHQVASGRVELAIDGGSFGTLWVSVVAGLAALAAGLGAEARRWRPAALRAAALALLSVAALTVPPLLELQLGAVVACSLSTAAVLAAVAWWSPAPRNGSLAAAGALAVTVLWSIGAESLELLAVGGALGLGALAVVRAMELGDTSLAGTGAVLAAGAVAAESGLAVSAMVDGTAWSWAAVSISAAVAGAVLVWSDLGRTVLRSLRVRQVADGRPPPPVAAGAGTGASRRLPAGAAAVSAGGAALLVAHVLGLLAIDTGADSVALTVALSMGVAALTTVAVLLRRSEAGWWVWASLAGFEALVLVMLRLADAGAATPEAYSLPISAVLVLVACSFAVDRRGRFAGSPSWMMEGPASAMALGPTVLVALGDPGLTRQLAGLAAGLLLLVVGAVMRRRAPIDVGAAAVAVLGVQGLLPYAQEVPRWISFGLVGAVLVGLGATFEQRRRDVRQARRQYAALQ